MVPLNTPYSGELPSSQSEISQKHLVELLLHLEVDIQVVSSQYFPVEHLVPVATLKGDFRSPEEEQKYKDRKGDPKTSCWMKVDSKPSEGKLIESRLEMKATDNGRQAFWYLSLHLQVLRTK